MQTFDTILPGEKNVLAFNCATGLANGNLLNGTPTATVTVHAGNEDASPQTILNGSGQLDSTKTKILIPIFPQVDGVIYKIIAGCATNDSNVYLKCPALLPVSSGGP